MLYAKLRICKLLNEELENLENLKKEFLKGDPLTEAGLKQIKAAKRIEAEIESVAELRDEYISAVKNDENFKKMDSYLQNACIDYYFNKEISETKINDKYHITGFVKKIYRQLHKF